MNQKRTRITNAAAAARASTTTRTLRRWVDDEEVGYPKPFVVRGRIYFWEDEILSWEQKNPGFGKPERTPEEQAERAKPKAQKKAKPKREPAPKSPMQVMMVVDLENLILPGNAATGYVKVSK
jgi:hypothetical protein